MEGILIFVMSIIVLAPAALRWGVDSREGVNDTDWIRRQAWNGL